LWPPLYMVAFVLMVSSSSFMFESFHTLMVVHGATMLVSVLLLVFYVVHLFKTDHVARDQKALWGVALFLGSPIAMPIYWFVHVWPDARPSWPLESVVPPSESSPRP
jgi:hypothetical protein